MSKLNYKVNLLRITANPSFKEASKEELRALISLIETGGDINSLSALSESAGISSARCRAALAFWEEAGVIREDDGTPSIIDEFEERLVKGEIDEEPAVEVADSIRNENLASMIDECALLMGQACLSNTEVKKITGLYTQYSLTPDYILTLAAYLASKGSLNVKKLTNEAIRISDKGIKDAENLDAYLKNLEESCGSEWEIRRIIGIYGRNLSPSEKGCFKKWVEEFGFSSPIITEAYDITINNKGDGLKNYLPFMDTILTDWHNAGCRTVSECKARSEAKKAEYAAEKAVKKNTKSKPETPRYGNFDVNEAFMNALERSFKSDET